MKEFMRFNGASGYGVCCRTREYIEKGIDSLDVLSITVAQDFGMDSGDVAGMIISCPLFEVGDSEPCLVSIRKGLKEKPKPEEDQAFMELWEAYGKKVGREPAFKAWRNLSSIDKELVFKHVPHFVQATADVQYRPYLSTYLHQRRFCEQIYDRKSGTVVYDPDGVAVDTKPVSLPGFQG